MRCDVLLFASYADLFGAPSVTIEVADPDPTVRALVGALRDTPWGAQLPSRPLIAVNRRYAPEAQTLRSGDEIALIPPVSGG